MKGHPSSRPAGGDPSPTVDSEGGATIARREPDSGSVVTDPAVGVEGPADAASGQETADNPAEVVPISAVDRAPVTVRRPLKPAVLRRRIERSITILIAANVGVLAVLLGLVFLDHVTGPAAGHPPQSAPSASVPASPTAGLMQMGLAHIPTNNSCTLCHEAGGKSGLKPVPAILHPIEGWRRCVLCHTNESLGRTAPGHEGIAEAECLNCHTVAPAGPAITQPHAALHDQHCLDCHGSVAHLPTSMATTKEGDCVLCHKPATLPPPKYPHAKEVPLSCRTCHQSPEVGGLPIDHALRGDATCLLCHDIKQVAASPATD